MSDPRSREIRALVWVMILGLVLSGITAYPIEWELGLLVGICDSIPVWEPLAAWIRRVQEGVSATSRAYPFLAYGTDWLAFAHLVIAGAFWGVLRDPKRNLWIVE